MFEHVPFRASHIVPLLKQPSNAKHWARFIDGGLADALEREGIARTGIVNGEVMFCGGITKYWEGRGITWIIFNEESKACFVPVFRGIRKWLQEQPYRRIELTTPVDNEQFHRRARMWGFKLEAPKMEKFLPSGEDCALYALVRSENVI